ncbi:MAG TPA: hypothetical protein VEL76_08900 [Gemmataceae bacterium]|nr:hypothetical protein [Gemmataceae bacterium]
MDQVGSPDILNALWQLVVALGTLTVGLLTLALRWSLLIVWIAWWLWGVNWQKAWPVLARGAWAPVVLLLVTAALVWSRLAPSSCDCLVLVTVPNFWWQLGAVGLLAAVALLCGWLQGVFGWTPAEIHLEPPAVGADMHGHEHPVGTQHGHAVAHSEEPKH